MKIAKIKEEEKMEFRWCLIHLDSEGAILFLQEFFLFFTSVPYCRESNTTGKKTKGIGISRTNWTITYIPISTCVLEDGARRSALVSRSISLLPSYRDSGQIDRVL